MLLRDQLEDEIRKAASDAVLKESRFRIQDVALRRQQGAITTQEFYAAMQHETKLTVAAQMADARGGWGGMQAADWQRAEQLILEQWEGVEGKFPGLRAFVEDTVGGRYNLGADGSTLRQAFLNRAALYADSGRAVYENERTFMHREEGFTLAKRLLAASDHCPGCVEAASEDWVPIDEVLEIGSADCGVNCNCVIIFRQGD